MVYLRVNGHIMRLSIMNQSVLDLFVLEAHMGSCEYQAEGTTT